MNIPVHEVVREHALLSCALTRTNNADVDRLELTQSFDEVLRPARRLHESIVVDLQT